MEFSEKLKELRSEKGISQAKLAADIHISRSAVAKWENGLGLPSDESLKMLAEYFGVGVGELLPDKSNEEILVEKKQNDCETEKCNYRYFVWVRSQPVCFRVCVC